MLDEPSAVSVFLAACVTWHFGRDGWLHVRTCFARSPPWFRHRSFALAREERAEENERVATTSRQEGVLELPGRFQCADEWHPANQKRETAGSELRLEQGKFGAWQQ